MENQKKLTIDPNLARTYVTSDVRREWTEWYAKQQAQVIHQYTQTDYWDSSALEKLKNIYALGLKPKETVDDIKRLQEEQAKISAERREREERIELMSLHSTWFINKEALG